MTKDEEFEVELDSIRKEFQDFLTEIPEDDLIERAKEIESKLGINPAEVPEYTDTDLDERYSKLMELVGQRKD